MLTRMVAAEAGPRVLVNAADPGWVATRMGGGGAPTPVAEGADTAVWLATLPDEPDAGARRRLRHLQHGRRPGRGRRGATWRTGYVGVVTQVDALLPGLRGAR